MSGPFHDVIEVAVAPVCLRTGCGHTEAEHLSELGWCDECMCQGFLSEDTFEPSEVEELRQGEESP